MKTNKNEKLYFAYGSNLELNNMRGRCPDAEVYKKNVKLEGWELNFRTYLTIEKKEGAVTPGTVFKVSERDIMNLDYYEGYPYMYYKAYLKLADGTKVMTYVMNTLQRDRKMSSQRYLSIVQRGYKQNNINPVYLDEALDRVIPEIIVRYDGRDYEGTPLEIVKEMNATTKYPRRNYRIYMADYADRFRIWNKHIINYADPLNFLKDLESEGLLSIKIKYYHNEGVVK